jgi:hypothetical protein
VRIERATLARTSIALAPRVWQALPAAVRAALWLPGVAWHSRGNRVESEALEKDAVARVTAALDTRAASYVLIPEGARRCRACGCVDAFACDGRCAWVAVDLCSTCTGRTQPLPRVELRPPEVAS